ncbi:MAG: hypothetical protein QOH10_2263 [Actinomycetota bacterium]|nr:hypothetical protein [Actinomycetota bacterium]
MTDQSRSDHPIPDEVNILVSDPELHAAWSATTTSNTSGGVSGVNHRMFARYPTPARRARTSIVGVLIAALLGIFAVMSGSAAPSGASGANYLGSVALSPIKRPVTGMASTPTGRGYWLAADDGGVFSFGDARFYGSTGAIRLNRPIVDIASTVSGHGYWLVASDGGVFSFGDARFYGSTGAIRLNRPIVGIAATPSGRGYWLAASDGGIFSFGDARFYGSTGGLRLHRPVVGIAATPRSRGYWLVASDGGIFSFGDAHYYGSTGGQTLNSPIIGVSRQARGAGYWLIAHDGGVFGFGQAAFLGSGGGSSMLSPTVATAASPGGGYWLATEDGGVYTASAGGTWIPDPHDSGTPEQRISIEVFYRTNEERRARGLRALTWDAQLSSLASSWSSTMARTGSFSHRNLGSLFGSPTYKDRYRTLEENIYEGNGSFGTAGSAHVALMTSAPHRAAMLNPGLTSLGVGAYCRSGTLFVTQDFGTWVTMPSPPSGAIPPVNPFVRDDYNGVACP